MSTSQHHQQTGQYLESKALLIRPAVVDDLFGFHPRLALFLPTIYLLANHIQNLPAYMHGFASCSTQLPGGHLSVISRHSAARAELFDLRLLLHASILPTHSWSFRPTSINSFKGSLWTYHHQRSCY
jgi:hypothetical protein